MPRKATLILILSPAANALAAISASLEPFLVIATPSLTLLNVKNAVEGAATVPSYWSSNSSAAKTLAALIT